MTNLRVFIYFLGALHLILCIHVLHGQIGSCNVAYSANIELEVSSKEHVNIFFKTGRWFAVAFKVFHKYHYLKNSIRKIARIPVLL